MLFEVHLDDHIISEGLNSYSENKLIFFPIGELSNILSISVNFNSSAENVSGFILTEERTFFLDLKKKTVEISGQVKSFESGLVRIHKNDIFVESKLYSSWFPVDFQIDLAGLTLNINPREQLPIQARLTRDRKQNQNLNQGLNFRNVNTPYAIVDRPFVDQTIESTTKSSPGNENSSTFRYTTQLAGDLAGLEANALIQGNEKVSDQSRIILGRDDTEAQLLGPLKARSFSIGNVNLPALNYVTRTNSTGTGAIVSNRPLTTPSQFDSQDFSGDLLPGWDVELFHNGVFIAHRSSNGTSRYEFKGIDLLYGSNDFRLVFHGPMGQIREEKHRFLLEDAMVLPGETYYTAAAVTFGDGGFRNLLQVEQSLFSKLSATGGILSYKNNELNKNSQSITTSYYNLGLRSYLDSVSLRADAIGNDSGGILGALGLLTGFWNVSLSLSNAFLDRFSSEDFSSSDNPVKVRSKAKADTILQVGAQIPVSFEATRDELKNQEAIESISGKVSYFFRGLSLSNRIKTDFSSGIRTTTGELQVGGRIKKYNLRGTVGYDLSSTVQALNYDLNGDLTLKEGYNFMQSISTQLATEITTYEVGFNKNIGHLGVGLRVGTSNTGESSIALRLNASAALEPRQSTVRVSALPMTTSGAVSARTFLDKNMNGVMDEDDSPVAGVGFQIDRGQGVLKTDENGVAFLTHLPVHQRVNIALDRSTIEDPQMTPQKRGVRVLPRTGKVSLVDFPLSFTTEIDGVVVASQDDRKIPSANLELELVDKTPEENLISTAKTAFDGYYIFSEVPAGQYKIRVASEQAQRLKLVETELKTINVLPSSNFINGIDLQLRMPSTQKTAEASAQTRPQPVLVNKTKGELYYVILGAFVFSESFKILAEKLDQLKISYLKRLFVHSLKWYWLDIFESPDQGKAVEKQIYLKQYGYFGNITSKNGKFHLLIGPYFTEKRVQQEKLALAAAIPFQKTIEEVNQT